MTTTTDIEDLKILNEALGEKVRRSFRTFTRLYRSGGTNALRENQEIVEQHDRIVRLLHQNVVDLVASQELSEGDPVETVDGVLIVAKVTYMPYEVIMTEDGQPAIRVFHKEHYGDPGASVRYEVWSDEGREAHGYVGGKSRYITQTG